MREFIQTRRTLNNPLSSTSFRANNAQEKDESLAAIMARRRQIADSEKVVETDETSAKAFSPRSNRMKLVESMGSTPSAGMNSSEHTPTNSVETPTPVPEPGTLNELQMAMFKRRTKVEDTTASILSPRQKRRNLTQHHIPMSPTLQEKLQKQLYRADCRMNDNASSPQNSTSAKSSGSVQKRLGSTKTGSPKPKVLLSVLPSPILTSPHRNHNNGNASIDSDERSRMSTATSSTNATNKSRLLPYIVRNLDEDVINEEIGEEEESDVDRNDDEGLGEEDDQSESETSILYNETDNEDVSPGSDDDSGPVYASSDDGINISSNISSSADDYLYANSDDSSSEINPRLTRAETKRQRRPARRPRRKKPAIVSPRSRNQKGDDVDDGAEPSHDESGPTYSNESHLHEYPIASDTEDECDTLVGFDKADKFAKSDSFINDSNQTDSSEKNQGVGHDNDDANYDGAVSNEKVAGDSEDEMMTMYASTSTGGLMYDEQTVADESILFNDTGVNEEKVSEQDDLAQFVMERSSREFNDFGDYVKDEKQVIFRGDLSGGVGKHDSCQTSVFSYSQTSVDMSEQPMSLSSKSNICNQKESMFGSKVIDGRIDREVPLGGEDDDSNSMSSGGNRKKAKTALPCTRFCSKQMLIALILVGSVVIGVCIGLFLFNGKNADSGTSLPTNGDNTKQEIEDPTRSKIPPEQITAYDIICPLLIDCSTLVDTQSPSGRAFDWLVQNKTANPEQIGRAHV